MSYFAPIHRPTSVKHAIKLHLLSPDEQCLVLAKSNRLEIYRQKEDCLILTHTRNVYGKVSMLWRIRPGSSATDHLFIGTDRYTYFTISWDVQSNRLRTEKRYVDQADKTSKDSETQDRCLIDPSKQFMALLLYDGIVSILPLFSKGKRKSNSTIDELGDPIPVRIADFFVRSCVFLHPRERDKIQTQLAFLFEDSHQKVWLRVRGLDYSPGIGGDPGSADLENVLAERGDLELGSSHLIPVPGPTFGLLVLAETTISYFDDFDDEPLTEPLDEAAQFVTWTVVDDYRWVLADDYGKLYLLMLLIDGGLVNGWKLDIVGQTTRASTLVYLDNGYLFIGSHQGDSQVVNIQSGAVEIVQTISNIAPVLDFTIMDMGSRSGEGQTNEFSTGQARIVTGSGIFGDGSLRSVRSGVGLEEQGILGEMEHATDLFALRSTPNHPSDDILVVSFVNETRIFRFGADGEIEEQENFKSLLLSEETIVAAMLENDHIIQVTTSSIRLIDAENGMVVSEWSDTVGQRITAASAGKFNLILSVGGREALSFYMGDQLLLQARTQFPEGQISCVHASAIQPNLAFLGFWEGGEVAILDAQHLNILKKEKTSDDPTAIPRQILLENLLDSVEERLPTLLVSTANGEVATFTFNPQTHDLSSRNVTVLGTQQANLKAIPRGDTSLSNIFATCEHPSLIYGSEGRIIYSAVTAEKATSVCAFNSELYPGAIAIATPEDVRIALVDTERTTHVQTLHVGELVRRIAYSPSLKAFGIGTIHRFLRGTDEFVTSRFKLADEVLFKELDTFDLNEEELVESVMRADLCEEGGELVEYFVVGTTYMDEDSGDQIRGRILVFAVTTERTLKLITELPVKGACRALGCIDGKIVAALIKTVVIYALQSSRLQKICTYRTSTAPIDLAIHPPTSQIVVADLMKSISVLEYSPPVRTKGRDRPHRLSEKARHYQTVWSTALARVDESMWLLGDAEGNLTVLAQDTNALSDDDKKRLRVNSELRLGEMVNRIRPVTVNAPPSAAVVPKAFMATVDGGVYLFGLIGPSYLDLLMKLQSALALLVDSLGDVPFNTYRAFKSQVRAEDEPERFVDGELIEAFLDLPVTSQEKVVQGLGTVAQEKGGLEGIRELVESLRRLH